MKRLHWIGIVLGLLILAGAAWLFAPTQTRFRAFDPVAVGQSEAGLWRAYYERRHGDLASALALDNHRLFGLTREASLRAGVSAAVAAKSFQDSHSREEAQAALDPLTDYFRVMADATGAEIDPAEAARLELEWWQLRREGVGPDGYAPAVAQAAAYLYGVEPQTLAEYARLRVAAMDLRDQKGREITDEDWAEISRLLVEAYRELLSVVQQA